MPSPGSESSPFLGWSVLESPPFSSRTVALLTQSYPAVLEVTLYSVGATDDWTSCELERAMTPPVRGGSAKSHMMSAQLGWARVRDDSASAG